MQYKKQKKVAGGIPAVLSSMKHITAEAGLVRGTQILLKMNQTTGFDCPGCAWPDPDDRRAMTEFCENGAKAIAEETTKKRATPEFFSEYSIAALAQQSDFWLGKQGRLTHPLFKDEGQDHYRPLSWEAAFDCIATELKSLDSPDRATFYTSGRTSNEAAFLYQLFVRLFGTNNLPDCSNLCHESSGVALTETIGIGKGTVTLEDFDHADCIVVIGQNPGTNHPRMLTALQKAVRNGCKIIAINPLQEAGLTGFKHPQEMLGLLGRVTQLASLHLPVRINGDVALLKGIMKEMDEQQGKFNTPFIQDYTLGFEDFLRDLRQESWDRITVFSGISRQQIQETAAIINRSQRMIVCWAMGLTQHKNAVSNIQEVVNLLLLGGHFGRPGAGACPVRGHSNVQGDRTMGIFEKMPDAFLDRLGSEFQFNPPRKHGMDSVQSIRAMAEGKVKIFFGMGGNFLSASPDTNYVTKALRNCDLTVHVSTKLNRSHLVTGKRALILPCLGRTEMDIQKTGPQHITVEDSMGVIRSSRGTLKPASPELRSEVAIVAGLAQAVFGNTTSVKWQNLADNYDRIRDHISRVIPGFENFNQKIKNSFYLPNSVRDRFQFNTPSRKAYFTIHPIEPIEVPEKAFLLMTIRSHDQFNTTIYGLNDRYRGISEGRQVLLMNPEDIQKAHLAPGQPVDIQSIDTKTQSASSEGPERIARGFTLVPYAIPNGCVAAYFPETNILVPIDSTAEKSNTPIYKSIVVSVKCAEV